MLKSIDRYILRREISAFAVVLVLVTTMLALENVPRIWDAISQTSSPVWLMERMVLALLPEYLAVGMLVASFLAPAWVVRTMALRSEWPVLPALGLAPWRIMLAPMLLAILATGAQLTLRLSLEPHGEALFDELGTGLDKGAFGFPIRLQEFVRLDSTTTILLTPPTRPDRHFGNVFLRRGTDVFSAPGANAYRDRAGRIEIVLFDGRQIGPDEAGKDRVLDFVTFHFAFSPTAATEQLLPAGDRLRHMPLNSLMTGALGEAKSGVEARPITASLLARISNALFCLLLPWLAFVLAQPPRRERSGAGIAVGVGMLVLFLRTNSVVEDHFTQWPITAATLHLALWTAATAGLVRFGMTHDEGVVDHALNGAFAKGLHNWTRLRRWRLPRQATRRMPAITPA